jgi:hypothetical protein
LKADSDEEKRHVGVKLKKKWLKPELVVLVRSRSEETILLGCKLEATGVGADVENNACLESPVWPCTHSCYATWYS